MSIEQLTATDYLKDTGSYSCDALFAETITTEYAIRETWKTVARSVDVDSATIANADLRRMNESKAFCKSANAMELAKISVALKSNAVSLKPAGNERSNPKISSKWLSRSKLMFWILTSEK